MPTFAYTTVKNLSTYFYREELEAVTLGRSWYQIGDEVIVRPFAAPGARGIGLKSYSMKGSIRCWDWDGEKGILKALIDVAQEYGGDTINVIIAVQDMSHDDMRQWSWNVFMKRA